MEGFFNNKLILLRYCITLLQNILSRLHIYTHIDLNSKIKPQAATFTQLTNLTLANILVIP